MILMVCTLVLGTARMYDESCSIYDQIPYEVLLYTIHASNNTIFCDKITPPLPVENLPKRLVVFYSSFQKQRSIVNVPTSRRKGPVIDQTRDIHCFGFALEDRSRIWFAIRTKNTFIDCINSRIFKKNN